MERWLGRDYDLRPLVDAGLPANAVIPDDPKPADNILGYREIIGRFERKGLKVVGLRLLAVPLAGAVPPRVAYPILDRLGDLMWLAPGGQRAAVEEQAWADHAIWLAAQRAAVEIRPHVFRDEIADLQLRPRRLPESRERAQHLFRRQGFQRRHFPHPFQAEQHIGDARRTPQVVFQHVHRTCVVAHEIGPSVGVGF